MARVRACAALACARAATWHMRVCVRVCSRNACVCARACACVCVGVWAWRARGCGLRSCRTWRVIGKLVPARMALPASELATLLWQLRGVLWRRKKAVREHVAMNTEIGSAVFENIRFEVKRYGEYSRNSLPAFLFMGGRDAVVFLCTNNVARPVSSCAHLAFAQLR